MKALVFSVLFFAACTPGVTEDSCAQITVGDPRTQVNSTLGNAGSGGGGSDWCDVWYGQWTGGPCCAVALNTCDSDGTVSSVKYYDQGCSASDDSGSTTGGSSGGSTGSSNGTSTGNSGPANGTASLTVTGDAQNGFGSAQVDAVNCEAESSLTFTFPFYSWMKVAISDGGAQIEGGAGNVIYWHGSATTSSSASGETNLNATLTNIYEGYPGTITISGTYVCN